MNSIGLDPYTDPELSESSKNGPADSGGGIASASGMEAAWWRNWRAHADQAAHEQLATLYLPYARIVAASYYARRTHDDIEFGEYHQLASVGLLDAMERYDPAFGTQFKTFAARRMHGAILNGLERLTEKNQQIAIRKRLQQERLESVKEAASEQVRRSSDSGQAAAADFHGAEPDLAGNNLFRYLAEVGIGIALGVLLDGTGMMSDQASADFAVSPEVSYFRHDEIRRLQALVQATVAQLSRQEEKVIRYHYLQEISFDEIASAMGITRSRVSQIHRKALASMRELLARSPHCDISY